MTTKSKKMDADAMLSALNAPAAPSVKAPSTKSEKEPKAMEKGVIFRMSIGDWKRIKAMVLDRDTTMQGLLEEGINTLLKSRGLPPIGQAREK